MTIRGIPIRRMDELKDFIKNNNIEIAVLTIPKDKAIEVADTLADTEIKGIWNFAHTDLKLPKHIIVENVHLSDSLMSLSYRIGHQGEKVPEELALKCVGKNCPTHFLRVGLYNLRGIV